MSSSERAAFDPTYVRRYLKDQDVSPSPLSEGQATHRPLASDEYGWSASSDHHSTVSTWFNHEIEIPKPPDDDSLITSLHGSAERAAPLLSNDDFWSVLDDAILPWDDWLSTPYGSRQATTQPDSCHVFEFEQYVPDAQANHSKRNRLQRDEHNERQGNRQGIAVRQGAFCSDKVCGSNPNTTL